MQAVALASEVRRILIVDDVERNRTLTAAVLRGATYEVDSVSARSAREDKRYDLVLMGREMPGIGGHEAATRIRQRGGGGVRLAALSSRGGSPDRTRSVEAGMSARITRPIAPRELLREIERVFCQPATADASGIAATDPWDRQRYDEWVERLGADRMQGFLVRLLDELHRLLVLALESGDRPQAMHRLAHDVASTAGMLGFPDVTRCCRAMLEAPAADAGGRSRLAEALEAAIRRLERHLALEPKAGAAA